MKSAYFQNYNIVLFIISIFVSGLAAHTGIPALAIALGFIISMVIARFSMKKWWNGEVSAQIPSWKKYLMSGLVSLIGSQMGWAALLI